MGMRTAAFDRRRRIIYMYVAFGLKRYKIKNSAYLRVSMVLRVRRVMASRRRSLPRLEQRGMHSHQPIAAPPRQPCTATESELLARIDF